MLEFETTYKTLRVYFNTVAAAPMVWSVDDGDFSNEMNVSNIVTQGIGSYRYSGGKPNPTFPVAWVEYTDARIHRIDESDNIFIENSTD